MFYVSVCFMFSSPKFPQTSVGITRDNTYSIPRNNYSWRAFLKRKQKMHVSFDWTRFVISDVLSFFFFFFSLSQIISCSNVYPRLLLDGFILFPVILTILRVHARVTRARRTQSRGSLISSINAFN